MNPDHIAFWLSQLRPDHSITNTGNSIMAWLFSILMTMVLLLALFFIYKHCSRNGKYKRAVNTLEKIIKQGTDDENTRQLVTAINVLVKQVAEQTHHLPESHAMHGKKWVEFLDGSGKTNAFTKGNGKVLGFHYHPHQLGFTEKKQLQKTVENWLKEVTAHG